MKKTFIKVLACTVLFSTATFASAYSVTDLVKTDQLETLRSEGSLKYKKFKKGTTELSLLPKAEYGEILSSMWTKKASPVLIEENLYLIKKEDLNKDDVDSVTLSKASKIIRSISKMEGMKYYSHSEKKWGVLYKDAYCVSGPKSKTKVIDKTSGSADGKVLYCLLNDNSLGKTNYELKYYQNEQEVCVTFENMTDVSVGPITAVDEGNLHIGLLILDCGNEFLVYSVVEAKFPSVGFLEKKMNDSLSSRMDAIYNWFIKQF